MLPTHSESVQPVTWASFYDRRRYAILLVLLTALLVGPQIVLGLGMSTSIFEAILAVIVLAAVVSLCMESRQRMFALVLGLPTVLLTAGGLTLSGNVGSLAIWLGHLCAIVFLFGAAALIVQSLFASPIQSFDRILGAVCGYLFLGLGWAMIYWVIAGMDGGSFEVSSSLSEHPDWAQRQLQVLTYYSFVTLTTVGYGDVVPASSATRTLAWIEAICGQFYLAVIVAGLVSMLGPVQHRIKLVDGDSETTNFDRKK
jgi:hypothetical protein